jgi:hypothetical protein
MKNKSEPVFAKYLPRGLRLPEEALILPEKGNTIF